jgi:NAD+ diphosphatase
MSDPAVGFAGNRLDRLSLLRDDAEALARFAADPAARAVVFVQAMPVLRLDGASALHPLAQARQFGAAQAEVLLGRDEAGPIFALLLPDDAAKAAETAGDSGFIDERRLVLPNHPELLIHDLRAITMRNLLGEAELGALAQAKSILHWHFSHGFCPRCGASTALAAAGWRRDCPACGTRHFPRTDPVVIMLVTDCGNCLLGRQKQFPENMYSCLAGFVESGETLEAAVRREVMEEAGISVGAVRYAASQPWPFPASLMIGCIGEALSRDIVMDKLELEDCRWFSRAEALAMLAGPKEGFHAPGKIAIARTLLEMWVAGAIASDD